MVGGGSGQRHATEALTPHPRKETVCPLYRRLGSIAVLVWTEAEKSRPQSIASRYSDKDISTHNFEQLQPLEAFDSFVRCSIRVLIGNRPS